MKLKQIAAYAIFMTLAVFLVAMYFRGLQAVSRTERQAACLSLEGQPFIAEAPDFELAGLDGQKYRLSRYRGKVVLLNFWATWCPPCVEELPSLAEAQRALNPKNYAVLTVSVDENTQVIKDFLAQQRQGLVEGLPVLIDPTKKVPESYGTTKFPETFLVDPNGFVRYKFIYKRDWASPEVQACLRSLL